MEVIEIKIAMVKKGINQTELAKRLGVSKQYISQCFKSGDIPPKLNEKIKEILEV